MDKQIDKQNNDVHPAANEIKIVYGIFGGIIIGASLFAVIYFPIRYAGQIHHDNDKTCENHVTSLRAFWGTKDFFQACNDSFSSCNTSNTYGSLTIISCNTTNALLGYGSTYTKWTGLTWKYYDDFVESLYVLRKVGGCFDVNTANKSAIYMWYCRQVSDFYDVCIPPADSHGCIDRNRAPDLNKSLQLSDHTIIFNSTWPFDGTMTPANTSLWKIGGEESGPCGGGSCIDAWCTVKAVLDSWIAGDLCGGH
jgi:hypothetical protein